MRKGVEIRRFKESHGHSLCGCITNDRSSLGLHYKPECLFWYKINTKQSIVTSRGGQMKESLLRLLRKKTSERRNGEMKILDRFPSPTEMIEEPR
jgi:hypothetical protein